MFPKKLFNEKFGQVGVIRFPDEGPTTDAKHCSEISHNFYS